MPRIRSWRKLKLYRSKRCDYALRCEPLFSGTVNWSLIREHYDLFMQLAVAIQSGALAPSAVLARINSYSTRNRFALALQELGKAVRTMFLLDWIMNDSMRRAVHKCTTKIERHHKFAKHLAFGEHGLLRSNDPSDQEKAIVYNELVANAVALQNVVDQTQALHALKSEGSRFSNADPHPYAKVVIRYRSRRFAIPELIRDGSPKCRVQSTQCAVFARASSTERSGISSITKRTASATDAGTSLGAIRGTMGRRWWSN
jgi:hypothetical protein